MKTIKVYTDGSCHNSGNKSMGIGVVVYGTKLIKEIAEYAGIGTSNRAEWEALISGLNFTVNYVLENYPNERVIIECYLDSKIVVGIITDIYSNVNFKSEYRRVKSLENKLKETHKLDYIWIPREDNEEADRLSKIGNPHFKS